MDSAKRASAPRTHILDRQVVAAGKGGKPAEVRETQQTLLQQQYTARCSVRIDSYVVVGLRSSPPRADPPSKEGVYGRYRTPWADFKALLIISTHDMI